jgi:hypothetical protein
MQHSGSAISSQPGTLPTALSARPPLLTSRQATLLGSLRCITSRALEDGRSLRVSLGGRTIDLSGLGLVHVSRSASPARARVKRTSATSGQNSSVSLQPAAPTSLWENRLRQRLASLGSTECVLTWKASATPQGRPLSRLVPSTRPTGGIDSGSWPTPTARLGDEQRGMPTAEQGLKRFESGRRNLEDAAAFSPWPTPTSRDHKDGSPCANVETNGLLGRMVWPYPTPSASMVTEQDMAQANVGGQQSEPSSLCGREGFGPTPILPAEQTEKPGALNPEFVSWLMGFPPEWVSCAPSVMPSSRKSRPKSSAPISTAGLSVPPPPY